MRNNTFFAFSFEDVSLAVGWAPYPKKLRGVGNFDVYATIFKQGGMGEVEREWFVGSFKLPVSPLTRRPDLLEVQRKAIALYRLQVEPCEQT